jgi:uncharacterized protein (TIGR02268 family)
MTVPVENEFKLFTSALARSRTCCGLLLIFVASTALARDLSDEITIRTLKVSEHPSEDAHDIYVAGQVVTVLRFEKAVDPAKTKLSGCDGRFEPLLVGGKMVVLEPIRDLDGGEVVPLPVTLVDGSRFAFLLKPPRRDDLGWIDHQVNVFKDHESYNAVLSSLYDSLSRERRLSEENERFKNEETSVDHAYATLLVKGEMKKTPFLRKMIYRPKNQDMDTFVEVFSGPGKAAVLVHLTNTRYGGTWTFDSALLTRGLTSAVRSSFALRMDQAEIAPGRSGKIAVVADKSAFEKEGQLVDLALQIFRGDGLLQLMVRMDHTLIRK